MQEATERQQIRSWNIHHLHNTPVKRSPDTIRQFIFDSICSKTEHAEKAADVAEMLLMFYNAFEALGQEISVAVNINESMNTGYLCTLGLWDIDLAQ